MTDFNVPQLTDGGGVESTDLLYAARPDGNGGYLDRKVTVPATSGGITALTGDATASGSGSVPITVTKINGQTPAVVALTGNYSDLINAPSLGSAAALDAGSSNGVATLDSGGKVPIAQIPSSIVGGLNYQGLWNATTNSPTLTSGTGTKGFMYKVSVAGTTTLDGISQWNVGDEAFFDGSVWEKLDGISSEVLSVAGRTGIVVLTNTDISGLGSMATQSADAVAITGGTITGLGNPTSSTDVANKSYVDQSIAGIAPARILVTATTKTLALSDAFTIQNCNSSSPQTITIPLNASVPFAVNSFTQIEANGTGSVTVTAAAGATLNGVSGGSFTTSSPQSTFYIVKDGTDAWYTEGAVAKAGGTNGQIQVNVLGAFGGVTPGGDVSFNPANGAFTVNTVGGIVPAGQLKPTAVKTANYSMVAQDFVPVDASAASVTLTLPTAPPDKTVAGVKLIGVSGAFIATISCGGSDVFNKTGGNTSVVLSLLNQGVILQYSAALAGWYVMSDDLGLSQLDLRYFNASNMNAGTLPVARLPTTGVSANILTAGTLANSLLSAAAQALASKSASFSTVTNGTTSLFPSAAYGFSINKLENLQVSVGSLTLTIQINGVNVPGLTSLNVTTTPQTATASSNNAVTIGKEVTMVLSAVSSAANLKFGFNGTLT